MRTPLIIAVIILLCTPVASEWIGKNNGVAVASAQRRGARGGPRSSKAPKSPRLRKGPPSSWKSPTKGAHDRIHSSRSVVARASSLVQKARLTDSQLAGHIIPRHGSGSTAGVSRFHRNDAIRTLIARALRSDKALIRLNRDSRGNVISGYRVEHTFPKSEPCIGVSRKGVETRSIRIVVRESGEIVTAFPL